MRIFEIYDTTKRGHAACAVLRFDEQNNQASIEIAPNATVDDLPFLLGMFAEREERHVPHKWAARWIAERVPPASRQNIGEILRANGLEEYDEIALLTAGNGRSSQDDFMIREVAGSVDYAFVRFDSKEIDGFDEFKRSVGLKLAAARQQAGLTQAELAEKTGIAQAVISRIERGKTNATIETLFILAQGAGCSLEVGFAGIEL